MIPYNFSAIFLLNLFSKTQVYSARPILHITLHLDERFKGTAYFRRCQYYFSTPDETVCEK
jgi:hypothetical protein